MLIDVRCAVVYRISRLPAARYRHELALEALMRPALLLLLVGSACTAPLPKQLPPAQVAAPNRSAPVSPRATTHAAVTTHSSVDATPLRLAVLPARTDAAAQSALPSVFDDYFLTAVQQCSDLQVVGHSDLDAMISLERQRDLLGCSDAECMTEVAGALAVERLLALTISRVGDTWALSAKLIDTQHMTVLQRTNYTVIGDGLTLLDHVSTIARKLFGKDSSTAGSPTTISPVTLRTANGHFVSASNGGGGAIIASATVAQAWERLTLVDVDGGSLQTGDVVLLRAGDGHYWMAQNGGGAELTATSNNQEEWETFRIFKRDAPGAISSGDRIGLKTANGAWVSAEDGGGHLVTARAGHFEAWETFVLEYGSAHSLTDH